MKEQDLRTPAEIFDDMLAEDYTPEEIGARLSWSPHQMRSHYLKVCREMGVVPDEE
jgi:hypothetical protein